MTVDKKKILILNNYSVERVRREVREGLKPSHHLYGIIELERNDYELIVIDPEKKIFWERVGFFFNTFLFLNLGDIHLQIRAFKRRKEYEIIYAPCQTVTLLLGILNRLGFFNKKIIAVAHHPFLVGRMAFIRKIGLKISLKGHHKWGALSTVVAKEINEITASDLASCLHWGPDLAYYDQILKRGVSDSTETSKVIDIIAIGRTGRDYEVLIKAFNNTDVKVGIYCSKEIKQQLPLEYTDNIKIIGLDDQESLSYPELVTIYRQSKIMAIPMYPQSTLAGLTSVTDAMALGMPTLITYNAFIEMDMLQEGIGYWVQARDSIDWIEKVNSILENNNDKKKGANARILAEHKYNSNIFYRELLALII